MYEFKLPDLGEGVAEGEILKWYVKVGDTIAEDAPLVDIETDKAAVTIPSPKGGAVKFLAGEVGDTIEVGSVLVTIDDGAAGASAAKPKEEKTSAKKTPPKRGAAQPAASADGHGATAKQPPRPAPPRTPAERPTPAAATATATRSGPVPAAPATRRIARELGVDINAVPGSGPAGRVTPEDVRLYAEGGVATMPAGDGGAGAPAPGGASVAIPFYEPEAMPNFEQYGEVEREAVRSIRRKVARKMTTSMITVPHVSHMDEADVTDLEAYRKRLKAEGAETFTLMAVIIKALTVCLREFPMYNASLDPFRNEIVYKKFYNVGFAADTPRGLLVPVVKRADQLNVMEISAVVRDLAGKAREGKIEVADLQGGTFTVTNVGAIGGTYVIPTINYPEAGILGMGRTMDRAIVVGGAVVARKTVPFCLTYDHRVCDGAQGARFMNRLVKLLSDPMNMLTTL